MTITKFGHSCFLIEEMDARILLDPGSYSTAQNTVQNIDAILITHEHPDHLSPESLRTILAGSPGAKIYTNAGVGKILDQENIKYELLLGGKLVAVKGVTIEGVGEKHAEIYPELPIVDNTGYLIAGRFFYPGDALTMPGKNVEMLALPVAAPWMKLSEAIDFGRKVAPKYCFPAHDGMLKFPGPVHMLPEKVLTPLGTKFIVLEEGQGYNL